MYSRSTRAAARREEASAIRTQAQADRSSGGEAGNEARQAAARVTAAAEARWLPIEPGDEHAQRVELSVELASKVVGESLTTTRAFARPSMLSSMTSKAASN